MTQSDDPLERLKARRAASAQPTDESAPVGFEGIRPMPMAGKVQGAAETLMDALSLNTSGVVGDLVTAALTDRKYNDLRTERKERRASVDPRVRIPLEIAGAMLTPMPGGGLLRLGNSGYSFGGPLIRQAAQTAPFLSRVGRAAADAGIQSGISGAAGSFDNLSGEGAKQAGATGLASGLVGTLVAGGLGTGTEVAVRSAKRIGGMGRLDKAAFHIVDDLAAADAKNYPLAERTMKSSPQMRAILNKDEVVSPLASSIRSEAAYQGRSVDDPKVLMAAYRRLSSQQRRAQASLDKAAEGAVGYDPALSEGVVENIKTAKKRILDVSNPAFRRAVKVHREKSANLDALKEGMDIGLAVGRNKAAEGSTITTKSREAYLRKIPQMSFTEAEGALAGILGRFPEQFSLTSSPLGLFGLVTSAVRSPLTAYRTMPIIRALEERLGRGSMGQASGDIVRGTAARAIGGLLGNY